MAEDFTWLDGDRLVRFGEGALGEAAGLLAQRAFESFALLSTERALKEAPESLRAAAGVVLEVPASPVPEAAAAVRGEVGERPVVALGGGRVIDSTKAIAAAEGLPCAAIPTTLSGAEMTRFHRMPAGVEGYGLTRPTVVVADAGVMASSPMPGLAATAMNALAHAIEALYGPLANPVATLAALRGVSLIADGLDRERPPELSLGALLGAYAVDSAGFAIHHAVCQTIVRELGTPHAETNAVFLPHAVRTMAERAPDALAGLDEALGEEPVAAITELAALAGPTRLSELGVAVDDLPAVAAAVMSHPAYANTPSAPDDVELVGILQAAM